MTKPVVTIGICVRNCAGTLRDAIESVMSQDYPHELIEVIFVDDGSEDDTLSIIEEYRGKMDMKVNIFHHRWKGLGYSRNVVVWNASGKYIIWVDGDMILPKSHVRKQVEFMEKNVNVGIAKAKHGFFPRNKLVAVLENLPYMVLDYESNKVKLGMLGTGGSIYRVEAIREVGGFDESIKGAGEDLDAARRILMKGWQFGRSNAMFFERRRETWKALWTEYFWWGYSMRQVLKENKGLVILYKMTPLFGFLAGILYSLKAYKLTRWKSAFLLPLQFIFKLTAWWVGYIKSRAKFGELK
ncbi:glycosyltransferase [Candidatus Bathyarchaeota archaeon]|nr:glycosyltransferase [Candidatus Bathyarchaeota archaeon]